MTTFKKYLQESDEDTTNRAESALEYMKEHCSESLWMLHAEPLWRGMSVESAGYSTAAHVKNVGWSVASAPTGRRSANTFNFYTALIDSNPAMADYPKRSSSWICSTASETAHGFGSGGRPFAVVPYDGAKIGVCSGSDLWNSKIQLIPGMGRPLRIQTVNFFWVDLLADMKQDHCTTLTAKDINPSNVDELLGDVAAYMARASGVKVLINNLIHAGIISETDSDDFAKMEYTDFIANIQRAYSPESLGFTLCNPTSIQQFTKDDREVWTDSDIMIIRADVWDRMQGLSK